MAKTTDNEELNALESLSKLIGTGRNNPMQSFESTILNRQSYGRNANAAKFLAGFTAQNRDQNMTDQASAAMMQKQLADMQKRYDAASILQKHEKDGLGHDMTFKVMMQRYAQTGDEFYKGIADQFKPSAKDVDPITMRKNYVVSKYGEDPDPRKMQNDPILNHFDDLTMKYLGVTPPGTVEGVRDNGDPIYVGSMSKFPDEQQISSTPEASGPGGLEGIWQSILGSKDAVVSKISGGNKQNSTSAPKSIRSMTSKLDSSSFTPPKIKNGEKWYKVRRKKDGQPGYVNEAELASTDEYTRV